MDKVWTLRNNGQTLDKVWTNLGQSLDIVSRLCPVTHSPGAPDSLAIRRVKKNEDVGANDFIAHVRCVSRFTYA